MNTFDLRIMVLIAIALLPLIITDYEVSRLEGVLLLFWALVYLVWSVLAASDHAFVTLFSRIVLFGLVPFTLIFLVVTVFNTCRRSPHQPLG